LTHDVLLNELDKPFQLLFWNGDELVVLLFVSLSLERTLLFLSLHLSSTGIGLLGLADSVWLFRSEPFRSPGFSVSKHFGQTIKSCRHLTY